MVAAKVRETALLFRLRAHITRTHSVSCSRHNRVPRIGAARKAPPLARRAHAGIFTGRLYLAAENCRPSRASCNTKFAGRRSATPLGRGQLRHYASLSALRQGYSLPRLRQLAQVAVLRILRLASGPARPPDPAPRRTYPSRPVIMSKTRPEICPGYASNSQKYQTWASPGQQSCDLSSARSDGMVRHSASADCRILATSN
jgi:hypothetical protein